jgi:Mn2+/Fe2+ NRAMP family transporter
MSTTHTKIDAPGAPIPKSFLDYVCSMGPGIVVVLTWLGAGDIVQSAAAGGSYGYALMWAFALCLAMRYLFVSIIAKYQLCNQHHESVLAGLTRLHRLFAPFVFVCSLIGGHAMGVVLLIGASQASVRLTQVGSTKSWAVGLSLLAFMIVFRPIYRSIEKVFFVLLSVLTLSLLILAGWAGPDLLGIAKGVFGFAVPDTVGRFDAIWIMVALVGAVGGGLANLMYPYFIQEKGWLTPAHLRVQRYDLILGIIVLFLLDLSIWVVGAEILKPKGIHVVDLESLARLLGEALGQLGTTLFYLGIFAALYSSIIGNGVAYGYLASDALRRWRPEAASTSGERYRKNQGYRWIVSWVILSPLFWILLGQSDFVGLTLTVNALQVVILPVLVVGVWMITAKTKYIGAKYRNQWWENIIMAFVLVLACIGVYFSLASTLS